MNLKRIVIIAGILAAMWFGLKWYADYQVLRYAFVCAQEMDLSKQLKAVKSDDQARILIGRHLDCVEGKLEFPASVFFDKKAALASMTFSATK